MIAWINLAVASINKGNLEEARRLGASEMFLEVAETNAAARALYARQGFGEIGRRARYYQDGQTETDALVLRRAL